MENLLLKLWSMRTISSRTWVGTLLPPWKVGCPLPLTESKSAIPRSLHTLIAQPDLDLLGRDLNHETRTRRYQLKLHLARSLPMDRLPIEQIDQRILTDAKDHEVLVIVDLRIIGQWISHDHNLRAWFQI